VNRQFDDAVVGAGILGLAHAYHLAKRGRRVVVFERSPEASGASVRNFGMLWPIGQPPGRRYDLARRSLEIWLEVLRSSGLWCERSGSLHLAYHDDEAQVLHEFVRDTSDRGSTVLFLNRKEVLERSHAVRPDFPFLSGRPFGS
jgi:glycine/D-amino acid oxidase-like deaminating enzyme